MEVFPPDEDVDTVMALLKQYGETSDMSLQLCAMLSALAVEKVNELFEQMAIAKLWSAFPEMLQVLFSRNENVKPGPGFIKPQRAVSAANAQKSNKNATPLTLQLFSPKTKCMWSSEPSIAKITAIVVFFELSRKQRRTFLEPIVKNEDFVRLLAASGEFVLLSRLLMVWMKMCINDARPERLQSLSLLENSGIDLCAIGMTEYVQTLQFYPREVWMGWSLATVVPMETAATMTMTATAHDVTRYEDYVDGGGGGYRNVELEQDLESGGTYSAGGSPRLLDTDNLFGGEEQEEREAWLASPAEEGGRASTPPLPFDDPGGGPVMFGFGFGYSHRYESYESYGETPAHLFLESVHEHEHADEQTPSGEKFIIHETGLFEDFGIPSSFTEKIEAAVESSNMQEENREEEMLLPTPTLVENARLTTADETVQVPVSGPDPEGSINAHNIKVARDLDDEMLRQRECRRAIRRQRKEKKRATGTATAADGLEGNVCFTSSTIALNDGATGSVSGLLLLTGTGATESSVESREQKKARKRERKARKEKGQGSSSSHKHRRHNFGIRV